MSGRGFLRHLLAKHGARKWDDNDRGHDRPDWHGWADKGWDGHSHQHKHPRSHRPGHRDDQPDQEPYSTFSGVGDYRTIDSIGNNGLIADRGAADSQFLRTAPSNYGDGISTPAGAGRPSAREVSNKIFAQGADQPNDAGASNLLWVWGQFLDHDIDLAAEGAGELFPIDVPPGDPQFDPLALGGQTILLTRSGFDPATGTAAPREQVNEITAFIDASNVYGADAAREAFLRAPDGKLAVSDGDYLPFNDGSFANAGPGGDTAFLAGDVRANENVALTSMHTIFVREHNRLVDELSDAHPDWDGETLYQEAKAIVEAEIQAVTYNEFLPLFLGENALPAYSGYRAAIDPGIANEFAGAAFRVGHTMLSGVIARMDESGDSIAQGDLALRQAFFNPTAFQETGPDAVMRGLSATLSQEIDTQVIDDVRNFLFGPPGSGGFDLVSLNIQRGRDHGLADYNSAREAYGLARVSSFAEITSDAALQQKLASLYGSVDDIDLFVGGLAEDQVAGAMVGELVLTILTDQFERLRDGDSFWYQNRFDENALRTLDQTTLSDIIVRNTGITHLQHDALMGADRTGGGDGADRLMGDEGRDLLIGFGGNDRLYGRGDTDDLFGDSGNDRLYGGRGDDYLHGGRGNDTLHGGSGDDVLRGDAGRDKLYGGRGDDALAGGAGGDSLTGGAGRDRFAFDRKDLGQGIDRVKDFRVGADGDILDLSDLLPGVAENDLSDYVSLAQRGGHTQVRVDIDGTDAGSSQVLAILEGVRGVDLDQLMTAGNIEV